MPPDIKNLELDTDMGKWRVEYIGEPVEAVDSGRIEYNLRFKWVDPHDGENKATPERRLRLVLHHEDMISNDAHDKLVTTLHNWIGNSDAETEARFDYTSPYLRSV